MRSVEEIKKDIVSFAEQRKAGKPADRGVEGIVWAEYLNALTASIPLDRLEAICAAEKEGRCVVLPETFTTERLGKLVDALNAAFLTLNTGAETRMPLAVMMMRDLMDGVMTGKAAEAAKPGDRHD
jgi:hypothetical protein